MTKIERKSVIDKAVAHWKWKNRHKRFPYHRLWSLRLEYELKEEGKSAITKWEYDFVRDILKKQEDTLFTLSEDQISKCKEIWSKYQTRDVR